MHNRAQEWSKAPSKRTQHVACNISNIVGCNMLHRLNPLLHDVAWCCMKFEPNQTSCNIVQQGVQTMHHVACNNVGWCACNMLRSFERTLSNVDGRAENGECALSLAPVSQLLWTRKERDCVQSSECETIASSVCKKTPCRPWSATSNSNHLQMLLAHSTYFPVSVCHP